MLLNELTDNSNSVHGNSPVTYAHGLMRKGIVLVVVMLLTAWLPGKQLKTCCFDSKLHYGHFAVLYFVAITPMTESIFDTEIPNYVRYVLALAIILMIMWFIHWKILPYLTPEVRVFIMPGKGWTGMHAGKSWRNSESCWTLTKKRTRELCSSRGIQSSKWSCNCACWVRSAERDQADPISLVDLRGETEL